MFGEHASFIIPSYVISFVALAVTALVIWRTHRARRAELNRLERERDQQS